MGGDTEVKVLKYISVDVSETENDSSDDYELGLFLRGSESESEILIFATFHHCHLKYDAIFLVLIQNQHTKARKR